MKQVEIAELERRIEAIGKDSALAPRLKGVEVEPAEDGLGGTFLRVTLTMDHPETLEWHDVKPLVTAIEDDVLEIDDRFPSVYFPDAA